MVRPRSPLRFPWPFFHLLLVGLIAGFPIALRAALPPISAYEEKLKSGWGLEKVLRRLQKDAREEEQKMRTAYLDAKKKLERARRDTGFGPQKNRGSLDTHFAEQLKELKNRGAWYAKRLEGASRRSPTAGLPPQPVAPPPPKPSPAPLAAPFPGSNASTPGSPPASAMKTTPPPAPAPAEEPARPTVPAPAAVKPVPAPLAAPFPTAAPPTPGTPPASAMKMTPAAKTSPPAKAPEPPTKRPPAPPPVPRPPTPPLPEFIYGTAAAEEPEMGFKDLKLAKFEAHGVASEFWAYRIAHPRNTRRKRSELYLEQTARPNDSLRLFFSERGNYDFAVRQRNRDSEGAPETEKDTNESTLEWREAYVDWSPGLFTVRVGAQQIVWGEAVGLFVADVVNARDFREMILPDTWLIRRPQWALDLVHNGGLFSQEFVLLVPRANRWPAVDSDFFFLPDEAGPLVRGVDLTTIPEQPLPVSLNTLESGGRLSMLAGGLDLSVFFLHSFEKDPVYFRVPNEANFTGDFEIRHPRQNYYGFTFSKDVSDAIVKGEMVAKPRRYTAIDNPDDEDNVDRRSAYDAMVGVDYTFFDNWDTNLQLIDRYVPGFSEDLIRVEKNRLYVAGRLSRKFVNNKLECEAILLHHFGKGDEIFRPKMLYKMSDWVTFKVGADVFSGSDPEGLFSVYARQDRVFSELSLHF